MENPSVFLKIPGDRFFLGLVRKVVVDFAEKVGFNETEASKLEMAVDEACSNVINHSYENNEEVLFHNQKNDIELKIGVDEHKIIIEVVDKGEVFNLIVINDHLQTITEVEDHLKKMNVNGLGLYIINNFMDSVNFTRTEDGYNKLTMTKLLNVS